MNEWIRKFIWKLRAMWTAADMIYESQRNVLSMTIELAREVEKRIKLKREVERLQKGIIDIADKADAHGHIGVRAECNALLIEEK